jgi:hypothetical protein
MRPVPICLAVALLVCTQLGATEVSSTARKTVDTIRQLRAIGLPNSDQLQAGPPERVPSLLRKLNQQLKTLIVEDLNDATKHAVPNQDEILGQLTAAGWEEIPSHKWNAYGEINQISFDWKTEYEPGLLIVSTQLWIPCGSADPDSAIYVFRGVARHWELVLATDADFDAPGAGTDSGMQYKISPPDSDGNWFLVVAHSPPSCRGANNILRYKVLQPGDTADKPEVLLTRRDKIDHGFDPPFRLDLQLDWFSVTEGVVRKLDGERGISISRYQLTGRHLQQLAPLALSPEDFLDHWVQLSWNDASEWTATPSNTGIPAWHSRLNSLAFDSTEMRSVHLCSETAEGDQSWLIELWIDRQLNPLVKEQELFIEIVRRNGVYLLNALQDTRPSGCQGKTPLKQNKDRSLPSW